MNEPNWELRRLVFEACLVAAWTDSSMSSDERRYLSHLVEVLSESEEERAALRELRRQELNEGRVLSDIRGLSDEDGAYVFDTCLDILSSDRRVGLREQRFLGALRKACGIAYWRYQRRLAARMPVMSALAALSIVFALAAATVLVAGHCAVDITPAESGTGSEVGVSTRAPDGGAKPPLQTGQEVFEHVRDGIVSVAVFRNNDFVSGGSGSVIGADESGLVYVITNKHVIRNSDTEKGRRHDTIRIEVRQHSGARFNAELDFYSREHDLALLAVKGMAPYTEPLKLTLKDNLRVGQPVYAVGTPVGLTDTFTAGVVSALRDAYLQTDATVHSGSSGGPLVDQHGALCGVVTSSHRAKDYGFALYADAVMEMLEERRERAERGPDEDPSAENGDSE